MNSKKLTLNLDELAVQSFATSNAGGRLGTVVGYSTPLVTTVEATIEICLETTEILTDAETVTKDPPVEELAAAPPPPAPAD